MTDMDGELSSDYFEREMHNSFSSCCWCCCCSSMLASLAFSKTIARNKVHNIFLEVVMVEIPLMPMVQSVDRGCSLQWQSKEANQRLIDQSTKVPHTPIPDISVLTKFSIQSSIRPCAFEFRTTEFSIRVLRWTPTRSSFIRCLATRHTVQPQTGVPFKNISWSNKRGLDTVCVHLLVLLPSYPGFARSWPNRQTSRPNGTTPTVSLRLKMNNRPSIDSNKPRVEFRVQTMIDEEV